MILTFLLLSVSAGALIGVVIGVEATPSRKILAVALILAASAGGLVAATSELHEKNSADASAKTVTPPPLDMARPCPEHTEEVVIPDEKTTLQMWLARHPEKEGG